MKCPCQGLEGLELVKCLAPPPGDYEIHVELPAGAILVVNDEGFTMRLIRKAEYLPFLTTIERRISISQALDVLKRSKLNIDRLTCMVIEGLRSAAMSGSRKARTKLEECSETIDALYKQCSRFR